MPTSKQLKGRGTRDKPNARYLEHDREQVDDGWFSEEAPSKLHTQLFIDHSKTIISYNQSPDVPFDRSINPYKGCEHGCVYCFARPTHAYLDLSPGLDFESKIFYKPDSAKLLTKELANKNYRAATLALGSNTDAYQPVERKLAITRQLLEVLEEHRHPVAIITKSALIERDVDILAAMARHQLVKVIVSVTTLDNPLSRRLEPRAAAPQRRLQTIRYLAEAGIPTGILFAPLIPVLNDSEMEQIMQACADAGAESASYVMLRLPHELKDLFQNWLTTHYPLKAEHVMNVVRDLRGGKAYRADYGQRMSGSGEYATLMAQRFELACRKAGLNRGYTSLNTDLFRIPEKSGDQLGLF